MPKESRQPKDSRSQWLKGVLDLCILGILQGGPTYGYDLAQRLTQTGLGEIKGGTLYPALSRLEADRQVTSAWREGDQGPNRKYYQISEAGRRRLGSEVPEWRQFIASAEALMRTTNEVET
jgi:PadR family transcriptional regulator PadR